MKRSSLIRTQISLLLCVLFLFATVLPTAAASVTITSHITISTNNKVYDGNPIEASATAYYLYSGDYIPVPEEAGSYTYHYWPYESYRQTDPIKGLPVEAGIYVIQATFVPNLDLEKPFTEVSSNPTPVIITPIEDNGEEPEDKPSTDEDVDCAVRIFEEEGRDYEWYQIFAGDAAKLDDGRTYLSNITWGSGITEEGKTALIEWFKEEIDPSVEAPTPADIAKAMNQFNAPEFAQRFGDYLNKVDGNGTYVWGDGSASGEDPYYLFALYEEGYYLFREAEGSVQGEWNSATAFLLQVYDKEHGDYIDIYPKKLDVESDKQVANYDADIYANGSFVTSMGWDEEDAVNAALGEKVVFDLVAKFEQNYIDERGAHNFENYETYKVIFHDTMDKGLTVDPDSFVVYTNGDRTTPVDPKYYTVDIVLNEDDTTSITVTFEDLIDMPYTWPKDSDMMAFKRLDVVYLASLNKLANYVVEGNDNTMYVEYSNDPNVESTGKTPDDSVTVYTFAFEIIKVDGDSDARLEGAKFRVYRLINGDKYYLTDDYIHEGEQVKYNFIKNGIESALTFTTDENGYAIVTHLDAGTYYLEEYEAPTGYNKLEKAIEVTVGERAADGLAQVTVENEKGLVLPSTGGMGLTLIYAVGGLLLVGGGIWFFVRSRRNKEDDEDEN